MADKDRPNRAANKEKAEGDRSTAEHNNAVPNSESSTDRGYRDENGRSAACRRTTSGRAATRTWSDDERQSRTTP